MKNNELTDKLVELESRSAFQEDAIQALTSTVSRQQQELGRLTDLVKQLRERLDGVAAEVSQRAPGEPPPPHY